jgi:hypothetical protein
MFRLFPDLSEDLLLNLFHKGIHAQWSSRDLDWESPLVFTEAQCRSLGRILTPVYLGEQSAMLGAAAILPQMAEAGESTAQVYLCSFMMDEGRHFEALTRLYHHMKQEPIPIRQMPSMLRYHHRLRQGDRVDWVWGILISDLFAKNFYQMFAKSQPQALFGDMSRRVLQDESRHQAFADHYLKAAIRQLPEERLIALRIMRDDLLRIMETMHVQLREDADCIDLDGASFLEHLVTDISQHAVRIGLDQPPDGPGRRPRPAPLAKTVDLSSARPHHRPKSSGRRPQMAAPTEPAEDCDTCYLAAICHSRLARAVAR